jgi:hypothetical protein
MLRFSTGLRNALLGTIPSVVDAGSQIAFVNSTSRITDTESRFLANGFRPGDVIVVSGSDSGTNDDYYAITAVASDGSYLTVSPAPTDEAAAAATPTIACVTSKGFLDIFRHCTLLIYNGTQPATADAIESGTLLAQITVSSGTFTKGTATNGLDFDEPADGKISKAAAETWSGVGLVQGTAGWFRFYDNALETGVSTTAKRIDGAIAVSGAQLNMPTAVAVGAPITINQFDLTLPAYAS